MSYFYTFFNNTLTRLTFTFILKIVLKNIHKTTNINIKRWSTKKDGKRTFRDDNEKLGAVSDDERARVIAALKEYRSTVESSLKDDDDFFKVQDVALRLFAGTGSLGKTRYYVLVEGASKDADDDVILDGMQLNICLFVYFWFLIV